jgi:hypothetical protein
MAQDRHFRFVRFEGRIAIHEVWRVKGRLTVDPLPFSATIKDDGTLTRHLDLADVLWDVMEAQRHAVLDGETVTWKLNFDDS